MPSLGRFGRRPKAAPDLTNVIASIAREYTRKNGGSQGSGEPCSCVMPGQPWMPHNHEYAQTGKGTCARCECKWSLGAMMLAEDDPLRDTPEKAERYARTVAALRDRKDADAEAARELLGA